MEAHRIEALLRKFAATPSRHNAQRALVASTLAGALAKVGTKLDVPARVMASGCKSLDASCATAGALRR